jgi:hypothetical protein
VPAYLALVVPDTQSFMVIRAIRLLRVFRILKAARFLTEGQFLMTALRASRHKITLFLGAIVTAALIAGALMYVIEGERHGFTSIPRSMYWAVVTMTTVGYGDIAPRTPLRPPNGCRELASVIVRLDPILSPRRAGALDRRLEARVGATGDVRSTALRRRSPLGAVVHDQEDAEVRWTEGGGRRARHRLPDCAARAGCEAGPRGDDARRPLLSGRRRALRPTEISWR